MDFERIVSKTLFYDMPIGAAAAKIKEENSDAFLADFLAVTRKTNFAFTESELELLSRDFSEVWCNVNNDTYNSFPIYSKCFHVLFRFTDPLLHLDNKNQPVVHFENLLRWRMFTQITGEDLLTSAFMAKKAYERSWMPTLFAWSDVIEHDEANINRILEKGMSDVHMHFGASLAIFNLSWVSMMNDVTSNTDFNKNKLFEYAQENQPYLSFASQSYDLRTLWIVAAFLRKELYKLLYKPELPVDFKKCWQLLNDVVDRHNELGRIQADINIFACYSYREEGFGRIDYALNKQTGYANKQSVHLLECGERELLFRFFLKYLNGDSGVWHSAGYFYLYLLIKNQIRRELEYTNSHHGFLNFKHYQDRKTSFIPKQGIVERNYHNLVVQSSGTLERDCLEIRICGLTSLKKFNELKFRPDLFSNPFSDDLLGERLSLVYSFIKKNKDRSLSKDGIRFASLRKDVKRQSLKLAEENGHNKTIKLVGIDAAGNELECRPEVFAHAYRYLREMGIKGRTYHVGEDFYDIIDGLRAIDEAFLFLEMEKHCRLGHTLALGVNSYQYYKRRSHCVVMPRHNLFDNYVWLYQQIMRYNITAPSSLIADLEDRASILYYQIGYKNFSILKCWHAWLLRGDDFDELGESMWSRTSLCKSKLVSRAREDKDAVLMNELYAYDGQIRIQGAEIVEDKLPVGIEKVIEKLQDIMVRRISEAGVSIETNPSSNLCIGPFEKYEDLPLFKFAPLERDSHTSLVNVSVNTDDRGVFATSLYNEFSLVAAALFKQKNKDGERLWSNETIYRYIDWLRENGNKQRFDITK